MPPFGDGRGRRIGRPRLDAPLTMAAGSDILPPRYRSATPIGAGGMAVVYRAVDTTLGRHVAVKVLDERHAHDPALRSRFTREAYAATRLSGEAHVVTIFDVGEWHDRPYIVMEDLPGGSIAARLESGSVPPAVALEWLAGTAAALDAAHAAGVVHRDVKPANLLLDAEGTVRVADFGIASAAGTDSLTMTGTVLGTAGYLAPEQARGERATAASDRYALGIVAYELLTGARPFDSVAAGRGAVPPVRSRDPSLPAALDGVFERALADAPAARHSSARGLVADLRRALGGSTTATAATVVAERPPTRRHRTRPLVVLGLLAAGAAGAALTAVLVHRGPQAAPTVAPRTSVRTVTAPGTTVRQTVTATAPAPPPPPAPAADGHALNDSGYARLQSGDARGAVPLLRQAVRRLAGTGPGDPYEAYANYNLGVALLALGSCGEAIGYLDTARRLEPDRHEPRQALKRARRCAGRGGD